MNKFFVSFIVSFLPILLFGCGGGIREKTVGLVGSPGGTSFASTGGVRVTSGKFTGFVSAGTCGSPCGEVMEGTANRISCPLMELAGGER